MLEPLISFWLMLCHWVKFETAPTEEELEDTIELLKRQNLPLKLRARKNKSGQEEYILYVRDADRDLARYCTGWRPF